MIQVTFPIRPSLCYAICGMICSSHSLTLPLPAYPPSQVLKAQHTQQGRGGATVQVELRDVQSGLKSTEKLRTSEAIDCKEGTLRINNLTSAH